MYLQLWKWLYELSGDTGKLVKNLLGAYGKARRTVNLWMKSSASIHNKATE